MDDLGSLWDRIMAQGFRATIAETMNAKAHIGFRQLGSRNVKSPLPNPFNDMFLRKSRSVRRRLRSDAAISVVNHRLEVCATRASTHD